MQNPDLPAIVTGRFEFVHNVRVPGMLHGRVVRPPAVGAAVMAVDESSVRDMPGLVKVVVKKNFVGVVAQKPWQAMQAANKLNVTWTAGTGLPNQSDFADHLRNQKLTRDTVLVDSKDVDQRLERSGHRCSKPPTTTRTRCTGRWGVHARWRMCRAIKATLWFADTGSLVSAHNYRNSPGVEA